MAKGKVKWFSNQRGYGFITGDDSKDIFVHYSGITSEGYKSLQVDQEVEYEVTESTKGPQAINIKIIK